MNNPSKPTTINFVVMKFQIGDKIIVLHSDEEGVVVDIINEKMVMIEVRGVKFPAYNDQIDFPYFKMFTAKKIQPKRKIYAEDIKKEKPTGQKKEHDGGVYISFFPVFDKDIFDDDVVEKLKVYLVNLNNEDYEFQYDLNFSGQTRFSLKNSIIANSDFYIHDVIFEELSESPRFSFEFSLKKSDKKKAPYFETSLKLKGKQLFKKIEDIQLKNHPSFSFELFKVYPDRQDEEKLDLSKIYNAGFRVYDVSDSREHLPPARSVIDLHIEKLTDLPEKLSNQEIMQLQLNTFEKYYELAVLHHQSSLTVIHGIGEGRLRDEIHERLNAKKEVKSYVNQYNSLYGYGATEIFFSKNK
jgi:hypothetical protein